MSHANSHSRPQCFLMSDIRGDAQLFIHLLQDVAQVATYDETRDQWRWRARYATVIVMGNLIDRFEPHNWFHQQTLSTPEALAQSEKILTWIAQLRHHQSHHNRIVTVVGDHELTALKGVANPLLPTAINHPLHPTDRRLYREFVVQKLIPFLLHFSVLSLTWGAQPNIVAVSRGAWNRDWFTRHKVDSLKQLNTDWMNLLQGFTRKFHSTPFLQALLEDDSPVRSTALADNHSLWYRENQDFTGSLLKSRLLPAKIIQSCVSVQQMGFELTDLHLQRPGALDAALPTTMLAWRGGSGVESVYHIFNQAADVFCHQIQEERLPTVLRFSLVDQSLYLTEDILTSPSTRVETFCEPPKPDLPNLELEMHEVWQQNENDTTELGDLTPMKHGLKKVSRFMVFLLDAKGQEYSLVKDGCFVRFEKKEMHFLNDDDYGCESLLLHLQTKLLLPPESSTWLFSGVDYLYHTRIVLLQTPDTLTNQSYSSFWSHVKPLLSERPLSADGKLMWMLQMRRLLPFLDDVTPPILEDNMGTLIQLPVHWWKKKK